MESFGKPLHSETDLADQQDYVRMTGEDAGIARQAFSNIYRRYWQPLFWTATHVLRSSDDAADVVQDVFLSLWNRRQAIQLTGTLGGYLHTSVRYKAIHYIEKNITRRDYLAMLTETEVSSTTDSPETELQLKELRKLLHITVQQMPPKMQEVYRLSRQEHLSHREIAQQLGIAEETVKKHIQHALQLIKDSFAKKTGNDLS